MRGERGEKTDELGTKKFDAFLTLHTTKARPFKSPPTHSFKPNPTPLTAVKLVKPNPSLLISLNWILCNHIDHELLPADHNAIPSSSPKHLKNTQSNIRIHAQSMATSELLHAQHIKGILVKQVDGPMVSNVGPGWLLWLNPRPDNVPLRAVGRRRKKSCFCRIDRVFVTGSSAPEFSCTGAALFYYRWLSSSSRSPPLTPSSAVAATSVRPSLSPSSGDAELRRSTMMHCRLGDCRASNEPDASCLG
ncbi:hypothetical protein MUK42_06710 [Musa troglodytarum]|uniref:Uncharacterized protein n=1 Tax=Musa troglodytarum TaxID=320322 RepID=A0A9E7I0P5_9LILI|nr:hypothetical protein MUK42_06710 [Musa troglodytarum]